MSWLRHLAHYWRTHSNQIANALQRTRSGRVLVIGSNYGLTEALLALSCGVWLWSEELSGIVDSYYAATTRWGTEYFSYDTFTPYRGYDVVDTYRVFDRDLGDGDLYGSYLGTFWQQSQALLPVPDWVIWMTWDQWLIWATICLCAFSFVRRIRTSERFGKLPLSILLGQAIGGTDGADLFQAQYAEYLEQHRQFEDKNDVRGLARVRWQYRADCCRLTVACLWNLLRAGPEWLLQRFRPGDPDS